MDGNEYLYGTLSDLDGDGKSDMVMLGDQSFWVYHNKSASGAMTTSSFEARVGYQTSIDGNARGLVVGDLTGDGKPELIALRGLSNGQVAVLRNVSTSGSLTTSSFDPSLLFSVGSNPGHISMSDFDNDGRLDLVVTNEFDN
jgi:hypothetical protein